MNLVRIVLGGVLILAPDWPCMAQNWPPWGGNFFDQRPRLSERGPRWHEKKKPSTRHSDNKTRSVKLTQDGGPRPVIAPKAPPIVAFPHPFPVNSIVIDTSGRKLCFIVDEGRAYEYSIAVGR